MKFKNFLITLGVGFLLGCNPGSEQAIQAPLSKTETGKTNIEKLPPAVAEKALEQAQPIVINQQQYNGWNEAYVIGNGVVEAIVVPAVGRIMQLKFANDADGPFWSQAGLHGGKPNPASTEWANFGGDKSWPAPQADWPKITGRAWPPPIAFDAMPASIRTNENSITLIHAVDPHFGIRAERQISLEPGKATMKVITSYYKVKGEMVNVSIWTITQLNDPERVFMPESKLPAMPDGYIRQSENLPENIKVEEGLISLTRHKKLTSKIGNASEVMVWGGKNSLVKISQPREANRVYPDGNSSAEVYTNSDPFSYVELEVLGPLVQLKAGEKSSITTTYELHRRTAEPLVKQARAIIGAP